MSLNSIKEQQLQQENAKPAVQESAGMPDEETVKNSWPALVETTRSMPRLANALANATLTTREEDGFRVVSFEVSNEAQKNWIETNLLRKLESDLVRIVGSTHLRLEVATAQYVDQKVAYMPADKAKELIATNPEVKELVVDLGLDI